MRLASAILIAATAVAAAPAFAGTTETSSIVQMTILEPGDKRYKNFHGAIWLAHDKADYNYRWGGLQCKGRDLSDSSVQILFASFKSEYQVTLEYEETEHKGKSYRCIVGFTVSKT
jgi:hypothetical protein